MPIAADYLLKKSAILAAMGGAAKLKLRQFTLQIRQGLVEDSPVPRILAGFHLVQDPDA
jgi:hypothetical protein